MKNLRLSSFLAIMTISFILFSAPTMIKTAEFIMPGHNTRNGQLSIEDGIFSFILHYQVGYENFSSSYLLLWIDEPGILSLGIIRHELYFNKASKSHSQD
jgi:hypothetical protein